MATGTVVDVVMPQMGVSVSEGTITRWMKQVGDHIEADETIVEISTDKVDTEVPSPTSGIVREILADEGDTVPVNTRIAVIASGESAPGPQDPSPPAPEQNQRETPASPETSRTMAAQAAPAPHELSAEDGEDDESGRMFISPVVARMLAEHRLDVDQIPGTGRGGRVTKKDVQAFIESGGQAAPVIHDVPHFAPPAEETTVVSTPPPAPPPAPEPQGAPPAPPAPPP